ncbi:MAG: spore coat protein [Paenibacillaceae bacterium]
MATEIAMPQAGQLPQVKGPEMNDRDFINDILSMEKYLASGYSTGLSEMQNPKLRQDVQQLLIQSHNNQWASFNLMFQKGWYKMKAADSAEVSTTQQQFNDYKSQFPQFT